MKKQKKTRTTIINRFIFDSIEARHFHVTCLTTHGFENDVSILNADFTQKAHFSYAEKIPDDQRFRCNLTVRTPDVFPRRYV